MNSHATFAQEMLEGIYDSGRRDYVMFGEIHNLVAFDQFDEFTNKSECSRLFDCITIIRYLLNTGDFVGGAMVESAQRGYVFQLLPDAEALEERARRTFFRVGKIDPELGFGIRLQLLHKHARAPDVSAEIVKCMAFT